MLVSARQALLAFCYWLRVKLFERERVVLRKRESGFSGISLAIELKFDFSLVAIVFVGGCLSPLWSGVFFFLSHCESGFYKFLCIFSHFDKIFFKLIAIDKRNESKRFDNQVNDYKRCKRGQ